MLLKRTPIEHHEGLEGSHHWRCHHCYGKSCEWQQAPNSKFLLCPDVVYAFKEFITEAIKKIKKETEYDWKMWGVLVRVLDMNLREIQEWIDSTPEINRRWPDRDECFQTSAGDEEKAIDEAVPENKKDIIQSGRRVPTVQDCFRLLLQHGPFYDMDTERWKKDQ